MLLPVVMVWSLISLLYRSLLKDQFFKTIETVIHALVMLLETRAHVHLMLAETLAGQVCGSLIDLRRI